jgi:hypothetical protein
MSNPINSTPIRIVGTGSTTPGAATYQATVSPTGALSTVVEAATVPTLANVAMASAATEYSYILPIGTLKYFIKLRGSARLQLAFTLGGSSTTYLTISPGCFYSDSGLNLTSTVTIFFQSPSAGQLAEIVTWA